MARTYPGVTPLGKGRYRIRTEIKHPKTGRAQEIDRRINAKSAADAARTLAKERADWLAKSGRPAPKRMRLSEAMPAWLKAKSKKVKPSTASTYGSAVAWWSDVLGDYYLDRIDPDDVSDALAGAVEGGEASDTASGRLRVLRTFARETRCSAICEGVRVIRTVREVERIEDEGRGLTLEELRRFLDAGPTAWKTKNGEVMPAWRRAWALVATMAWTGMRFGEASALEWQDIDLDSATIRVRRAQWRGRVGHPKAAASRRTVAIPEELAEVLREHRHAMLEGPRAVSSALVFPSRRKGAGYVTNTHARKAILRVCEAAKIDLGGRPTVHMLRHTINNLIRQSTTELVRRALIGHADDASGERYSAVTVDERRAAVASVVRMVRGGE